MLQVSIAYFGKNFNEGIVENLVEKRLQQNQSSDTIINRNKKERMI